MLKFDRLPSTMLVGAGNKKPAIGGFWAEATRRINAGLC
jgi:hypothetical protein